MMVYFGLAWLALRLLVHLSPKPEAIEGSYTIDPAVFKDEDGGSLMRLGRSLGWSISMLEN